MIGRILRTGTALAVVVFTGASTAFAQASGNLTFQQLVDDRIVPLVDTAVIPLLYVLAFLFFMFGVVKYFFTGGQENREIARVYIMWSLIGMVVIFGVWGIVRLLLTVLVPTA